MLILLRTLLFMQENRGAQEGQKYVSIHSWHVQNIRIRGYHYKESAKREGRLIAQIN